RHRRCERPSESDDCAFCRNHGFVCEKALSRKCECKSVSHIPFEIIKTFINQEPIPKLITISINPSETTAEEFLSFYSNFKTIWNLIPLFETTKMTAEIAEETANALINSNHIFHIETAKVTAEVTGYMKNQLDQRSYIYNENCTSKLILHILTYRATRDGFDYNKFIANNCSGAILGLIKISDPDVKGSNTHSLSRVVNFSTAIYSYGGNWMNFGNADLVLNGQHGTCTQGQYDKKILNVNNVVVKELETFVVQKK
ncbi:29449_t:CDS:2, partial [Racocetra persica]